MPDWFIPSTSLQGSTMTVLRLSALFGLLRQRPSWLLSQRNRFDSCGKPWRRPGVVFVEILRPPGCVVRSLNVTQHVLVSHPMCLSSNTLDPDVYVQAKASPFTMIAPGCEISCSSLEVKLRKFPANVYETPARPHEDV